MEKDILDKLELKNNENLSRNRMNDNVLGMNRDLDYLKINDDFSNEEVIEDEFSIFENNSYVDLSDIVSDMEIKKTDDIKKADISALPLDNE